MQFNFYSIYQDFYLISAFVFESFLHNRENIRFGHSFIDLSSIMLKV